MAPRRLMDVCLAALEKQITDHADAQQMLEFLRDKGTDDQLGAKFLRSHEYRNYNRKY